jgi:hypothetical protein
MREYVIKSEERWAYENNGLREELRMAETIAVESKLKLAQIAADKDFYMFKYNELLSELDSKSGTVTATNNNNNAKGIKIKKNSTSTKRSSIKNLFEDLKCRFAFSKKK